MENSLPLLEELQKKDEDAKIISSNVFGTVIETGLDIGYSLEEEEEEDFTIVIETPSIPVRIIRHVFVINISIAFLYALFGMVPYSLMVDASIIVPVTLFITSTIASIVCGVFMYRYSDHRVASISLFTMWVCSTFVMVCSLSASLKSLAPFQACSIFFIQCIVGLLYCLLAGKDQVEPWWAAGIMMTGGLCIWALGLYSFVKEQDW